MAIIDLPDIISNFTTTLAVRVTKQAADLVINRSDDGEGGELNSTYWVTINEGTASEEHMVVTFTGANGVIVKRGLNKTDVNTEVEANKHDHDRGVNVKITNVGLVAINRLLKGTDTFNNVDWSGVNSISGVATPLANELNKVTNVDYVNNIIAAGAANADENTIGISKLSLAPSDAEEPIAVGDNDTRVPTQDENDALQGTSGAPSDANRYVTSDDVSTTAAANKVVRRDAEGKIAGEDTVTTIQTHTASENITAGQACLKTVVSTSVGENGNTVSFGTTAAEQIIQEITFPHDTVFSSVILNLSKVGSPDDLEVQLLDENGVQLAVKKVGSLVASGAVKVLLGAHRVTANTVYKLRIGQENDGTSDVNFYQLETNVLDEVNLPNWQAKTVDNGVETPIIRNTNIEVFYEGVLLAQGGVVGRDPFLGGSEGSLMIAESDVAKGASGKFVVDGVVSSTNLSYTPNTSDVTVFNQTQQAGNNAYYGTEANNGVFEMTYFMGRYMSVRSFSIKIFSNPGNSATVRARFNDENNITLKSVAGNAVGAFNNGGSTHTFDNIRLTAPRIGSSFTISVAFSGGGGDQGFICSTGALPANAKSVPTIDGSRITVSTGEGKGNHPAGKLVLTDKVSFFDGCAVYLSSTEAGAFSYDQTDGVYVGKAAGHEKLYVNSPQKRQIISNTTISTDLDNNISVALTRAEVPALTTGMFSSQYINQTTNYFENWDADFLCASLTQANTSTRLTFFS